jgi:hypothetical protein
MRRRLVTFIAGCAGGWLALAGPAWGLGGAPGLVNLTIAAVLCGVPAFLTLALAELNAGRAPEVRAAVVAAGAVVRMIAVLGGSALLVVGFPRLTAGGDLLFWGWVIVFYLFTLAWEVAVVAGLSPAADRQVAVPAADSGTASELSPRVTRSS